MSSVVQRSMWNLRAWELGDWVEFDHDGVRLSFNATSCEVLVDDTRYTVDIGFDNMTLIEEAA